MRRALLPAALLLGSFASGAIAHELRPAYLGLRETGPERYDALWKVPARGGDLRLSLRVELPDRCARSTEPRGILAGSAYSERWSAVCAGGLGGGTIRIAGLSATLTDALVRIERLDGTTQVGRLTSAAPSFVVESTPGPLRVAGTYLRLGIEHILSGVDHLAFVLALLLLVRRWRRVVATVTAFTVAHSWTLGAATLGFVHVPGPPVEATIALSVAFVAREIVEDQKGRPGLAARRPWLVAFTFGLLHGFGFAGALADVGLPASAIPLALLFFNLGVELGQLVFIAAVISGVVVARRIAGRVTRSAPAWSWRLPPYAIGGVAAYWMIERISAF